jgi:hypothetical protein
MGLILKQINEKKMKKIIKPFLSIIALVVISVSTGCLKHGMEDLKNSNQNALSTVDYTYRFLYDDVIKEGTPNQENLKDRVCEVVFKKVSTPITVNGKTGFSTTLTYDANSVLKAGPTGKVTKADLYAKFQTLIANDQLNKLWVYITVPDASIVTPLEDAPKLGTPADFSKDRYYRVTAADGSSKDYVIRTIKGF